MTTETMPTLGQGGAEEANNEGVYENRIVISRNREPRI